ncbi:MAG: hypothetical protein LBU27_01435 [Candidatus Peribacteria bacterium]|jgi:hypothetical protein|nr:hypothetical protein [Candidatus Peribacteria bacterium]
MKQKVWTTLIKETFTTDQKLFESFHRESLEHSLFREDTKGEQVSSDF